MDLSFEEWVCEIARILMMDPQEIADRPGIEDLYRGRLSPLEAADCLTLW